MIMNGNDINQLFEPAEDVVVGKTWDGSDIYDYESYYETDKGKVLNDTEQIIYFLEHHKLLPEVMELFGILKEGD